MLMNERKPMSTSKLSAAGIAVLCLVLAALLVANINERSNQERVREERNRAIVAAEEWKSVAERWERIAHSFEAEAKKCQR